MMQSGAYDNVERRLAEYFGRTAREAPLSDGFWPRLRARLAMQAPSGPSLWRRLTARRWAVASTAAVLALAIVTAAALPSILDEREGSEATYSGITRTDDGADGTPGPAGERGAAGSVDTSVTLSGQNDLSGTNKSVDDEPFFITTSSDSLAEYSALPDTPAPEPSNGQA